MKPYRMFRTFSVAMTVLFSIHTQGLAWDQHRGIMELILDSNPQIPQAGLGRMIDVPSEAEQKIEIQSLAVELQINAEKIPLLKPGKISVREMLISDAVDEPDFGMDQNLPDSADPAGDRAWMGGKQGPTSQGFRHMVFPGIEWGSPLRTLQIPTRSIGQAPDRIVKLQQVSQNYFAAKKEYWALRVLLWEIHLIQDLHQPFHVMQVPYYRMLPWSDLFSGFVARSTRVISNYHYAYEGLVREAVSESILSELAPCMQGPGAIGGKVASSTGAPTTTAAAVTVASVQELIGQSRSRAEAIGVPLFELWDPIMKDPEVNLPEEEGSVDYYAFLHANAEEEAQGPRIESVRKLMKETCGLMKSLSALTLSELDRVLRP